MSFIMNYTKSTTILLIGNDIDYVLFKLAVDSARKGLRVWFISIKPFDKVPQEIEQPSKEDLKLITFIYLKECVELVKYLNSLHKRNNLPNVFILNNFEQYCHLSEAQYNSQRSAFLAASLLDCTNFLNKQLQNKTLFLVACSRGSGNRQTMKERLQVLCDMYFNYILHQDQTEREQLFEKIKHIWSI